MILCLLTCATGPVLRLVLLSNHKFFSLQKYKSQSSYLLIFLLNFTNLFLSYKIVCHKKKIKNFISNSLALN